MKTRNDVRTAVLSNFTVNAWVKLSSRFSTADDTLSRAASAVSAIRREHAEGAEADHGFDAGEFSGPAHASMEEREIIAALASFGLDPDSFNRLLNRRVDARFSYTRGLYA
jgi:hypothetical protein